MVPHDLTRIRFVGEPAISPDGRRVAFTVTMLSEERDEYLTNVWLVDLDGGDPRRLTAGPKRDRSPRWSPDGTRLAFVSEREGDKRPQLYVLRLDGGDPIRLTTLRDGVADPIWAPDAKRIAFTSRVGGYEEPEDETERKKSKPARVIVDLKYKFNGEGFVYDRRRHVFVVDAEGGEPRQVTGGDFVNTAPTWAPDGRSIAFVSARHPDRDYENASDLFLVRADGGEPRQLTRTIGPVANPSFAPDGRQIAFTCVPYKNRPGSNEHVFVIPLDGEPRALAVGWDVSVSNGLGTPRWLPDGDAVLVGADERGAVPLYRVGLDGGVPTSVVSGARQVQAFDLSADGRTLVFAAVDPVSPPELYVAAADGSGERRLTRFNDEWRGSVRLQSPEHFVAQRDGAAIDVWVMRPAQHEPGRRYPTLLNVHGGPHSQYGYNFFDEFLVQSGAGFAVVYTNPRGSLGYGEAFARAVVGDWGGVDYGDVMAGLDEALRRCDYLDPDRLGVLGGSYGGYMTSWIVSHSRRFKAACSERALNDWHSFVGTSDIGFHFAESESGDRPWDDVEWQMRHSPLTYARQIETPLLILHSEDDLRCPIEQAEQLFVALKKQRKDVLFIRFPDESHELSRSGKPRHRLARFGYILDWFARHL